MINNVECKSLAAENEPLEEEINLQESNELTSDNNIEDSENLNLNIEESVLEENTENNNDNNIIDEDFTNNVENETNKTEETNCLALTVRKDYGLFIFKNGLVKTFRVTCKVAFCTIFLNLLTLLL